MGSVTSVATERRAWLSSVLVEFRADHAFVSTSPQPQCCDTGMAGWPASIDGTLMAHVALVHWSRVA